MKNLIGTTLLYLVMTAAAFADGTVYHIFADGLACRYCAFAVDKQLKTVEGVESVDIHLDRGLVGVRMAEGHELTEAQLRTILDDAGVTFRSMEHHIPGAGGRKTGTTPPISEYENRVAAGAQYQMRVDGLACPYCAYGVEKKLKKIDGVEKIDIDLNNGLVTVNVAQGVTLTDAEMIKLFNDAGFSFRSMTTVPLHGTRSR